MNRLRRRRFATTFTIFAAALLAFGNSLADEVLDEVSAFDIRDQPLDQALLEFSKQADVQIIMAAETTRDLEAVGIHGSHRNRDALERLLADRGLQYTEHGNRTIAVHQAVAAEEGGDSDSGNRRAAGVTPRPVMMAQARTALEPDQTSRRPAIDSDTDENKRPLEEIVVTGTNIRGIAPVGAQPFVIDREAIDKLGVGTAQEIVRTLPQNFNGGVGGEDRRIQGGDSVLNASGGAGVNLRGLGGDSTLVLVNGRRLPQGASPIGQFVDISTIPVSAIERVEVLPDGASALYGSDAIAGVVNFVLRKNYEGAETRLRHGTVTNGSLDEYQASQILGKNFGRGNVLVGYEYYRRDALPAAERKFAANSDLTDVGGLDGGSPMANPGNIDQVIFPDGSTQSVTFAIPEGQDGTNLQPGDLLAGVINRDNSNEGRWLLAKQERHSAFVTSNYELSPSTELFAEFRYTKRAFETRQSGETVRDIIVPDSNPFFVTPVAGASAVRLDYNMIDDIGPRRDIGDVESTAAAAGFTHEFNDDWALELYGSFGQETTTSSANVVHLGRLVEALGVDNPDTPFDPAVDGYFNPFADGSNTAQPVLDYVQGFADGTQEVALWTTRGKLDAKVFSLPGGDIRIAVGGEYRHESRKVQRLVFDSTPEPVVPTTESATTRPGKRDVAAAFGEIYIPVFSEQNARPGFEELAISVAGRYETYSDFGSSTDPKFGARWSPVTGLTFRGTYGTSYKAPRLTQLGDSYAAVVFPVVDPETVLTGTTVALVLQGENPNLSEETSTSWTVGLDFQPDFAPGFRFEGTYFSIDFTDQVGEFSSSPFSALVFPEIFGTVTTRNPDPAEVQGLIDGADFVLDLGGGAPVEAFVDARITNLAITEISGLDLVAQYDTETGIGDWSFGLNASYLFEFKQASTPGAPLLEFLDTLHNPLNLRMRGNVNWSSGRASASLFVNYADDYSNDTFDPARKISAWTTVDLQARYDLGGLGSSLFEGASLSMNMQNLFDEEPPFAVSGFPGNPGLAYDSENADPLGRFVSIQLTKSW